MGLEENDISSSPNRAEEPERVARARVVLVLSLSKRAPGELVRIIMDWLDDADLSEFCRRYLDDSDLAYIQRG
jgi:hypothetical protein